MAKPISIEVWNPSGKYRVVSTKSMPGTRWIRLLTDNDCRLEVIIERSLVPFIAVHSLTQQSSIIN
jgi:hydroxypyruvate reductase 1